MITNERRKEIISNLLRIDNVYLTDEQEEAILDAVNIIKEPLVEELETKKAYWAPAWEGFKYCSYCGFVIKEDSKIYECPECGCLMEEKNA